MKTQRNILMAFILNLSFSLFELLGGLWIGSVAILSDALHDMGDALSIGLAYFLERKSKRPPDDTHTYGYGRYSALGGIITSGILLAGSVMVILSAIDRLIHPTPIRYTGMILFALVGAAVNLVAAFFTRDGDSLNQKAVNLHMLEDVLGWIVVLIGAVIMRFTDLSILDPLLSVGVALFILIHAFKNLAEAAALFLNKVPAGISIPALKQELCSISGVNDIHHLHIWSLDAHCHCATLHAVIDGSPALVKNTLRQQFHVHGIDHVTLELETTDEICADPVCTVSASHHSCHHHHHHH